MTSNKNESQRCFLPIPRAASTIPNPPLPFWPRPPSLCEGLFSGDLTEASLSLFFQEHDKELHQHRVQDEEDNNVLPDLETLMYRRASLVNLRQILDDHFEAVTAWAQQCHAQQSSQRNHHHHHHNHPSFDLLGTSTTFHRASEWIEFIQAIQVYLKEHVVSKYQCIETAIEAITQQVSELQDTMIARLVQLEEEIALLQTKRRTFHDATR